MDPLGTTSGIRLCARSLLANKELFVPPKADAARNRQDDWAIQAQLVCAILQVPNKQRRKAAGRAIKMGRWR